MGCDPRCYVDGKDCAISLDGKCAIIHPLEENKQTFKEFMNSFKEMVKVRQLSSPSDRSYSYDPTEKKKRKIAP